VFRLQAGKYGADRIIEFLVDTIDSQLDGATIAPESLNTLLTNVGI
jgi:hypothetical protein